MPSSWRANTAQFPRARYGHDCVRGSCTSGGWSADNACPPDSTEGTTGTGPAADHVRCRVGAAVFLKLICAKTGTGYDTDRRRFRLAATQRLVSAGFLNARFPRGSAEGITVLVDRPNATDWRSCPLLVPALRWTSRPVAELVVGPAGGRCVRRAPFVRSGANHADAGGSSFAALPPPKK